MAGGGRIATTEVAAVGNIDFASTIIANATSHSAAIADTAGDARPHTAGSYPNAGT